MAGKRTKAALVGVHVSLSVLLSVFSTHWQSSNFKGEQVRTKWTQSLQMDVIWACSISAISGESNYAHLSPLQLSLSISNICYIFLPLHFRWKYWTFFLPQFINLITEITCHISINGWNSKQDYISNQWLSTFMLSDVLRWTLCGQGLISDVCEVFTVPQNNHSVPLKPFTLRNFSKH